jgi:signal peptidase I
MTTQTHEETRTTIGPATSAPAGEKVRTDLAGWLHLVRLSVARAMVWFVFCLAFFAVVLVPFGRFTVTVIASGSMRPGIGPGDVVVAREADESTELLGRVVTAQDPGHPGTLLTHRIVADNGDGTFQTKGDDNSTPDSEPMPRENIAGRGFMLVPWIGLPVDWTADANWVPLTLVVAGLGVVTLAAFDRDEDADDVNAAARRRTRRERNGERRRSTVRLGTAFVAIALVAMPAMGGRSAATLTASAQDNAHNNWATKPAALLDNDGGVPLFNQAIYAGVRYAKVIEVSQDGTTPVPVGLMTTGVAEDVTGQQQKLNVTIERGTKGTAAYPGESTFTPEATIVSDTQLGKLTTLDAFEAGRRGVDTGVTLGQGQTKAFRITIWYPNTESGPAAVTVTNGWQFYSRNATPAIAPTSNPTNTLTVARTYPDIVTADGPWLQYRFKNDTATEGQADPGLRNKAIQNTGSSATAGTTWSWTTYGTPNKAPAVAARTGLQASYGTTGDKLAHSMADGYIYGGTRVAYPTEVTVEAWVKAGPGIYGNIVTFADVAEGNNATTGAPSGHRLYIGNDSKLRFGGKADDGDRSDQFVGVTAPAGLATGWHLVQATMSATANKTALYVDGTEVATAATHLPSIQPIVTSDGGWWRVGWQHQGMTTLSSWPAMDYGLSGEEGYNGEIDEVATYHRVLSADQRNSHLNAGFGRSVVASGVRSVGRTAAPATTPEAVVPEAPTAAPAATPAAVTPEATGPETVAPEPATPEVVVPEAPVAEAPVPEVVEPDAPAVDPAPAPAPAPAPEPVTEDEQRLIDLVVAADADHALEPEDIDLLRDALVADRNAAEAAIAAGRALPARRPGEAVAAWMALFAPGVPAEDGVTVSGPDTRNPISVLVWDFAVEGRLPEPVTAAAPAAPAAA